MPGDPNIQESPGLMGLSIKDILKKSNTYLSPIGFHVKIQIKLIKVRLEYPSDISFLTIN